ncbi:MAG: T9SS type A sorting domain-containing protein [Chitinophagales bacterium]
MKNWFFALLTFLIVQNACAQTTVLTQFTGIQQDATIQLSFTIKGGNTCLGTEIQRSPDSIHFETIGMIAGICGSNDKDETYTFTDENPLTNQHNFYRLVLGQLGVTDHIKVFYVNYGNSLLIFPNPVTLSSMCYFENDNNELAELRIFNVYGILESSIVTRAAAVSLQSNDLSAGTYIITLTQDGIIRYSRKFIVQ